MRPLVIACGDHLGIGPEVTFGALATELGAGALADAEPEYVLVGDAEILEAARRKQGQVSRDRIRIWHVPGPGMGSESASAVSASGSASALHALECLRLAARGCLDGTFSALVTAPVSKERILRAGVAFVGQTEFLAEMAGVCEVTMMLLGDDERGRWLRVGLVSTHLPMRLVADAVTADAVVRAIRHSGEACRRLGLRRCRIGVAGLNPHAGEGGMLGDEEVLIVQPAIERARREGCDAIGPIPGDTVFHQALRGDYDAVVAMYHDQGLAPLKVLAFDRGVNWTLGLPFVRTSPDHGTAFDIAGRGLADASSMRAAIRMATALGRGR